MTTSQVPAAIDLSVKQATAPHSPAAQPPTDAGLLDLRTFVILVCSLVTALITGAGAALAAAYTIEQTPVAAGLIAGLAAGIPTLLGTAATMNSLISRPRP